MQNKNKHKGIIDKYEQPIYIPNNLYVCRNVDTKTLGKYFKFQDGNTIQPSDLEGYDGITFYSMFENKTNKACIVIYLCKDSEFKGLKNLPEVADTYAHEAFHAAHRILDYCGVTLDNGSCEAYAYMVGWITKCIFTTAMK